LNVGLQTYLPARILTLVILITYNTEILINKIFKMLQF